MGEPTRDRPWQILLTGKDIGQIDVATRQALEQILELFTEVGGLVVQTTGRQGKRDAKRPARALIILFFAHSYGVAEARERLTMRRRIGESPQRLRIQLSLEIATIRTAHAEVHRSSTAS